MPDRKNRRSQAGRSGRGTETTAPEATIDRKQVTSPRGRPGTETLTEQDKRPHITLENGAVVDAREAAAVWRDLDALQAVDPDEFRSLLALAQGRPSDADPQHFKSLRSDDLLKDDHSINPIAREVLLNTYKITHDGPVIVPLRLRDEADRSVAEQALAECDQFVRDVAFGRKGKDRSRD
jgi:hypothetical protein